MLVIFFVITVGALVVLINRPRWYAKWEIEPWLFKWVLSGVIVVYAVAFVLTYTSVIG